MNDKVSSLNRIYLRNARDWFNVCKSIVICYINKIKKRHCKIISEKALDKIQHSLLIKTLSKLGIEVNFFKKGGILMKKPSASIMLNDERLHAFPLK